jgi:prophage regulatory protein
MSDQILISLNDVCKRTSLSRTQINSYRAQGRFPRAVSLGFKRIAFVATEVEAWINERIAARDQEAA